MSSSLICSISVLQNSKLCPCWPPQVALFDRIHSIRVKHIQEEYQKYMERVRGKAQAAIDQARLLIPQATAVQSLVIVGPAFSAIVSCAIELNCPCHCEHCSWQVGA